MDTKHCYRFGYRWGERPDRKVDIHSLRDGEAFNFIASVFYEEGYRRGEIFINTPIPEPENLVPIDDSFLKPSDILLVTTRPPMDDVYSKPRRASCPSYTMLEAKIFVSLRVCFEMCSRDMIKLARFLADRLPPKYADRAQIQFRQNQSADYRFVRSHEKGRWKEFEGDRRTALFLIFLSEPWPNGPQLLAAFGVGGNETLFWARLLATRFRKELEIRSSRFVMAEMKQGRIPRRPNDLRFVDDWEVRMLLSVPIEEAAIRRAS